MKEKILILGRPGSGKPDLARRLARSLNYDLVDEVTDAWWIFVNGKPKTVYVSNSITHAEADMREVVVRCNCPGSYTNVTGHKTVTVPVDKITLLSDY